MKTAILQCADAGPAESFRMMLNAVGYKVVMPNDALRAELRSIGCDTVLSPKDLTRGMGYDPVDFPEVGINAVDRCDLFCDVKAHRSYDKLCRRWPALEGKVLWTRINGGRPEHVINLRGDHGDEIYPPCPVLTPNQWYKDCESWHNERTCNAYTCWPPFYRWDEYQHTRKPVGSLYTPPICLIHNLQGWGYGALVETFRDKLGIKMYGAGSPDGLIQHREVAARLSSTLCMVHLKSNDAPGYALYEAMASACPVVCTRRLIWRCKMEELLIPDETCLVFDRETHDPLSKEDVLECEQEVAGHLKRLSDPAENRRIGDVGRAILKELMWSSDKKEDVKSLRAFMERNFS